MKKAASRTLAAASLIVRWPSQGIASLLDLLTTTEWRLTALSVALILGAPVATALAKVPPARVVVLDDRSQHLKLVQAVWDAYKSDIMTPPSTEVAPAVEVDQQSSLEGRLMALVEGVLDGTIQLPSVAPEAAVLASYDLNPVVTSVAAELDTAAGQALPMIEGTIVAIGQYTPGQQLSYLPADVRDGFCTMPVVRILPAITDTLGRHIQKPAAALKLDATLCQYVVPTAREARRVFNKAKHEEQRAIKLGQGQVFDGTGSLPAEGGAVADDTVLSSCNGFTVNQCGYGNTTSSARLYLRNFSGSVVETNVLSQSYWRWAGDHVDCTNANGSMFDHVLWEGPDVSDSGAAIRFEPRDCLPSRGEVCSQGSCPIQWAVSTRAWDTGNIQNLWNAAIGYHRFHYWIPEIPGVPFPGIHHMLYHWLRTEFLVNAKHDTWAGTSCQEGGSYGAGFPFYTYQLCQGYLPTAFH